MRHVNVVVSAALAAVVCGVLAAQAPQGEAPATARRPPAPIFTRAVSMAVKSRALRTMVGSGVDGSAFPHGTQALEFELLVARTGATTTQALQAGTIVNARVMG